MPAPLADDIRAENERLFRRWERSMDDSRLRDRAFGQVPTPMGLATPMFCMNCGRSCGHVVGDVSFTHALCDPCGERFGGLPGVPGRIGTIDADGVVHF